MKSYSLLALLVLISPISTFADTAKCQITGAKEASAFSNFVGGEIAIDLSNGNSMLTQTKGAALEQLAVISSNQVSSFGAPRSGCTYGTDKVLHPDGSLRAMVFNFNNCLLRNSTDNSSDNRAAGYVRANVGFDLTDNYGIYQEILLTPAGVAPSAYVEFKDCKIETEVETPGSQRQL